MTVAEFNKLSSEQQAQFLKDQEARLRKGQRVFEHINLYNPQDLGHQLPNLDATGMFEESVFIKNKKET